MDHGRIRMTRRLGRREGLPARNNELGQQNIRLCFKNPGISELSRKGELMVAKCGFYQCVTTTDDPRSESDYLFELLS